MRSRQSPTKQLASLVPPSGKARCSCGCVMSWEPSIPMKHSPPSSHRVVNLPNLCCVRACEPGMVQVGSGQSRRSAASGCSNTMWRMMCSDGARTGLRDEGPAGREPQHLAQHIADSRTLVQTVRMVASSCPLPTSGVACPARSSSSQRSPTWSRSPIDA
jgi:hypothetical protein